MKKSLKIISVILISLAGFGVYAMHVIETQLVEKLPALLTQNKLLPVTTGPIHHGKCLIHACLIIPNVVVHPANQAPLSLGTVSLDIPPLWPVRATIKNTDSPFSADMTLGAHHWEIRHLSGQYGPLHFDATGAVQTTAETGEITIQTTGLKTFLTDTFDLPQPISWLFTDTPSTLTLQPKDGWLRFQGYPLIPLTQ